MMQYKMKKLQYKLFGSLLIALSLFLQRPAKSDFDDKPVTETPAPTAPSKSKGSKSSNGSINKTDKKTKGNANTNSKSDSQPTGDDKKATADSAFDHDTSAPVTYSAESGAGSRKDGAMELIKNVVITQALTTMWSDKAEIFSVPGTTKPKRILSSGHVKLQKKATPQSVEINATADQIEYFADSQKAILRGRPVIQKGMEILRGEQIEIDMVTEVIKVKNPSGVVDPKSQPTPPAGEKGTKNKK